MGDVHLGIQHTPDPERCTLLEELVHLFSSSALLVTRGLFEEPNRIAISPPIGLVKTRNWELAFIVAQHHQATDLKNFIYNLVQDLNQRSIDQQGGPGPRGRMATFFYTTMISLPRQTLSDDLKILHFISERIEGSRAWDNAFGLDQPFSFKEYLRDMSTNGSIISDKVENKQKHASPSGPPAHS